MLDIVLDENVYIRALEAECTQGGEDLRAAQIVLLLQEHHRWVFSIEIIGAYRRQFSARECKGFLTSELMKSMNQVLLDSRRSAVLTEAPPVEGSYHHKDRHMVAAAAASKGCCLVTIDVIRNLLSIGLECRTGLSSRALDPVVHTRPNDSGFRITVLC